MFLVNVTYNNFSNKNMKTLFLASGYQNIKTLSRQSCIYSRMEGVGVAWPGHQESLGLLKDSTDLCIWLVGGENG